MIVKPMKFMQKYIYCNYFFSILEFLFILYIFYLISNKLNIIFYFFNFLQNIHHHFEEVPIFLQAIPLQTGDKIAMKTDEDFPSV